MNSRWHVNRSAKAGGTEMFIMARRGLLLGALVGLLVPCVLAHGGQTCSRRALVLCGHPGNDTYRQAYERSARTIQRALTDRYAFAAEHVWVRAGTAPRTKDEPDWRGYRGPATREAIAADVAELKRAAAPEDAVWVILIGHSHFDGRHVFVNLPGRDMDETDFGKLFEGLKCREQVFFITVPSSGFFIKHLSAKGRVVVTATEADAEVNEALFHAALADVLSDPPEPVQFDRDQDSRLTVLDLYLTAVRRVMHAYYDLHNIPTEHALLDDNGDGRGTELQLDDLEPELGGRAMRRPLRVVIRSPADGALAASIEVPGLRSFQQSSDNPR